MELTLQTESIKDYFEGKAEAQAPARELIYLHSHPLVRPSFLTEIHNLIREAGELIVSRNVTGKVIEDLSRIAVLIGTQLPEVNQGNALIILEELRNLYRLCNNVIRTYSNP